MSGGAEEGEERQADAEGAVERTHGGLAGKSSRWHLQPRLSQRRPRS
jgi:hypothetical protein